MRNEQGPADSAVVEEATTDPIGVTLREFRECLRTAGSFSPGDRFGHEWRVLRAFFESRGRVTPHDPALWRGAKGGSEHQARFIEATKRWEKVTRADFPGWRIERVGETFISRTALPSEYLERLSLVNEVFGDSITVEGIETGPKNELRIRTTQPHVHGEWPLEEEILRGLAMVGFERVADLKVAAYDSMSWRLGELWLFDVRPMNFVKVTRMDDDGVERRYIAPIDVIVQTSVEEVDV